MLIQNIYSSLGEKKIKLGHQIALNKIY